MPRRGSRGQSFFHRRPLSRRYDPDKHHRRSIRLPGFDYTQQGAYFVTICTLRGRCLFGEVEDGDVVWNDSGRMVEAHWRAIPEHFRQVRLDAFVVMPNHIHGIILLPDGIGDPDDGVMGSVDDIPVESQVIVAQRRATTRVAPTKPSLAAVVGAFKSCTTVEYIRRAKTLGWARFSGKLWQRNYYEHIIRDDEALDRIRQYIAENPIRWADDLENPARKAPRRP